MPYRTELDFTVKGQPVPQGSMRAFNNRIVHVNAKPLNLWRRTVRDAYRGSLFDGPVMVSMVFTLPRGRTVRRARPFVKPDLDKLVRAILDALTGAAFHDDAQVTSITARKEYGPSPGVRIKVVSDEP